MCEVKRNDTFNIGKLRDRCLTIPSDLSEEICYYITGDQDTPAVIAGDTDCIGGYTTLFTATPEQLYRAFIEILGSLPNETKVYCHEDSFTESRLKFAQSVEPENQIIRYKLEWVRKQFEKNNRIVRSTIEVEKLTNPFMRVHEQSVMDHTGEKDPIQIMASLKRKWQYFKP